MGGSSCKLLMIGDELLALDAAAGFPLGRTGRHARVWQRQAYIEWRLSRPGQQIRIMIQGGCSPALSREIVHYRQSHFLSEQEESDTHLSYKSTNLSTSADVKGRPFQPLPSPLETLKSFFKAG